MTTVDWTTSEERVDEVVARIWKQFVGVPAVGAFASEHVWLQDQIKSLDRAAFTMGMREVNRQWQERNERTAAQPEPRK